MKNFFLFFILLFGVVGFTEEANCFLQQRESSSFVLKRIILVSTEKHCQKSDKEKFCGVEAIGLSVPGGVKKLEKKFLSKYLNRTIQADELIAIKKEIITYYQSYGYPLLNIQIPEQELTKGCLVLNVTQARLGDIEVLCNKYFKSKTLQRYIRVRSGELIDEKALLLDVATINKNPFRTADVVFTKGKKSGTTDIKLFTKDRFPFRIYTGLENNGVKLTKSNRWFAGFNWGDAFFIDHLFSYQYSTSFNFKTFQAHTAQYVAPLPWWNNTLTLYGGYSSVCADLPEIYEKAKSKGQSGQASLRYEIPLPPGIFFLENLNLGFDFKRTNNSLEYDELSPIYGGAVNLAQLVLGYEVLYSKKGYKTSFKTEFFASPGEWLVDQGNKRYELFRYRAQNKYFYLKARWENLITLPHEFLISYVMEGQYANQNLLPSEMYDVGGVNSVRGYSERTLAGDNGAFASLELRSPKLSWHKKIENDGLRLLAFVDFGLTVPHHRLPSEKSWQYIAGVGPGIRYAVDTYFSASLDLGLKLRRNEDFGSSRGYLHFNVTLAY